METLDCSLDGMDQQESWGERELGDVAQGLMWDGWKEECVRIQVPTGVKSKQRPAGEDASRTFNVNNLYCRQLVNIVWSTCESQAAGDFHYDPFTTHWDMPSWMPTLDSSSNNPATSRVHDELYTSDAWIEKQAKIDSLLDIPDDLPC
ncbi:hypothetical protein FRC04_011575 [Tulasnella sp. 424]|nr:hypothetical protein FRC04_011575 [Tulasnella sp. 424]